MLEAELIRGLTEGGIDVVQVGMGPSPMLYFATYYLDVDGGIQVTGSHNPADYNGFKLLLKGRSVFGEEIQAIGERAAARRLVRRHRQRRGSRHPRSLCERLLEGFAGQAYPPRLGRGQRRGGPDPRDAGRPASGAAFHDPHRGRRHASPTTTPIRRSRRTSPT